MTAVAWPAETALARTLARRAAEPTVWPGIGRRTPPPLQLIVVRDARALSKLTRGQAPGWSAALALPDLRTIVLRADAEPLVTLRHELAHLALHEAVRGMVPRWFDEGYATYAAGEWDRLERLTLNLTVASGAVPTLDELDAALRGPEHGADPAYGLSVTAVLELAARNPTRTLEPLFELLGQGVGFDDAVRRTTGLSPDRFDEAWRRSLRHRYGWAVWLAAGGAWTLVALVVLALPRIRRRADAARRAALDEGWPAPPNELDPPSESL